LSTDDTIAFDVDHIIHLDCRRPHELNNEERALLFTFCWDHPVAQCGACYQSFRQHQLAADLFGHHSHLCPRCRTDLTANLREHLFACALVPTEVRWKAEDARNAHPPAPSTVAASRRPDARRRLGDRRAPRRDPSRHLSLRRARLTASASWPSLAVNRARRV